ncbi:MAG: hypothetical protein WD696_04655 [Bryobacteraceae bacterium]
MLRLLLLFAALLSPATAQDPVRQTTYAGASHGFLTIPAFDKGYLIFLRNLGELRLYDPKGLPAYDTIVTQPDGRDLSIGSAAVDTDGTVAVAVGYASPKGGYAGGIVHLDRSGKQTRFIETGPYMPTQICFAPDHTTWTFGWQRGAPDFVREDGEDYFMVRRYSKNGKELGAYLPRSLFPPGLSPSSPGRGFWVIRAADSDRIGALAYRGSSREEWIEWDRSGKLIGRWKLDFEPNGGLAYTTDGRLYFHTWSRGAGRKGSRLVVLDRETSSWKEVPAPQTRNPYDRVNILLGADGNHLVFSMVPGETRLGWFAPPELSAPNQIQQAGK